LAFFKGGKDGHLLSMGHLSTWVAIFNGRTPLRRRWPAGALAVPLRPLAGVGGLPAPKLALDGTPEKVRPVFVFSQYAGDAEKGPRFKLQGRRLVVEIRDYWLATSGRSAHSSFAQKGRRSASNVAA
jgi:hypothetical protein